MTSILDRIFGRKRHGSSTTAKDRLRFVLQHDRINLPPERMAQMKSDILAVIVKYVVVDKEHVEIDLQQLDRSHSKLVAEIPLINQLVPPSPETDEKPENSKSSDVKASNDETPTSKAESETEAKSETEESDEEETEEDEDDEK